jgi:hypothetical protein
MGALTVSGDVFTWGCASTFSPLPFRLPLREKAVGRVSDFACGKRFTVVATMGLTRESYEKGSTDFKRITPHVPELVFPPELFIPKPPTFQDTKFKRNTSPKAAVPTVDLEADDEVAFERKVFACLKPLCRISWKCTGFEPSGTSLWKCQCCNYHRSFHGKRTGPMTDDEAARVVVGAWRGKHARRRIVQLAREQYQIVWDSETQLHFYYHIFAKTKTWSRPRIIADPSIVLQERNTDDDDPKIKPPLTLVSAARLVQGLWRSRKAYENYILVVKSHYDKVYDEHTKRYFYINKLTGSRSWGKPKALGSHDVDDDPSDHKQRRRKTKGGQKKRKGARRKRRKRRGPRTPEEAALVLQRLYRRRQAFSKLVKMAKERYSQAYDSASGKTYFYDRLTQKSMWQCPKLLQRAGGVDTKENAEALRKKAKRRIPKNRKRSNPHEWTEEEAAGVIQGLFRQHQSRYLIRRLLRVRYKKFYCPTAKRSYYHDTHTQKVFWTKPLVFKDWDVDEKATPRPRKRRRGDADDLTPEAAARIIQGYYRSRRARSFVKALIMTRFQRVYDPNTKRYFYHNKLSGEVSWTKPPFLKPSEDIPQFRSPAKNREDHRTWKRRQLVARRTKPPTEEEAVLILQRFFRAMIARGSILRLISRRYEKVLDPNTGSFFYFDRTTKSASWLKPILLGSQDLALKGENAGQKAHLLADLNSRAKRLLGFRDDDRPLASTSDGAPNTVINGMITKKCQVLPYPLLLS